MDAKERVDKVLLGDSWKRLEGGLCVESQVLICRAKEFVSSYLICWCGEVKVDILQSVAYQVLYGFCCHAMSLEHEMYSRWRLFV